MVFGKITSSQGLASQRPQAQEGIAFVKPQTPEQWDAFRTRYDAFQRGIDKVALEQKQQKFAEAKEKNPFLDTRPNAWSNLLQQPMTAEASWRSADTKSQPQKTDPSQSGQNGKDKGATEPKQPEGQGSKAGQRKVTTIQMAPDGSFSVSVRMETTSSGKKEEVTEVK